MRIAAFLLAVMFLVFAFLQVNDPDPVIWILIYGIMAVFSIMAMFRFYPRIVLALYLVLLAGYSVVFWSGVAEWWRQDNRSALFDDVAKMEHWYIEEAREFLGLLICMLALIFFLVRALRTNRS
jgi:hypothetical protein